MCHTRCSQLCRSERPCDGKFIVQGLVYAALCQGSFLLLSQAPVVEVGEDDFLLGKDVESQASALDLPVADAA